MKKEAWWNFKNWDYREFENKGKVIPEYGYLVRSFAQAIPLGDLLWKAGIMCQLMHAVTNTKHIKAGDTYVRVGGKEDIQKLRALLTGDPQPLVKKTVRRVR